VFVVEYESLMKEGKNFKHNEKYWHEISLAPAEPISASQPQLMSVSRLPACVGVLIRF
jgi:hypothetical protein